MSYKNYNKLELFNKIDKLSIYKNENMVITKYDNRVINTTKVSDRYEIFDIVSYLKEKISIIESNFDIKKYDLNIRGGIQSLRLVSDVVKIGDTDFYKSFYILNSTDRTRTLNFNLGLTSVSNDFYSVGAKNNSLVKKHLKGVTEAAELSSININTETFDEQIENISSLVNHRISLSKVREVILGNKEVIPNINHRKFDALKNSIRYSRNISLDRDKISFLNKYSKDIDSVPIEIDFYMDAFWVFKVYLSIFNSQDSHIVKNETSRIMNMTKWAVRNSVLESLGIF